MAVGTKDLAPDSLRSYDDDKLVDELKKAKAELFNLRFQSATGQLDNHGRLRAVRKDIARIYTEMRERELGIGLPPSGKTPAAPVVDEKAAKKARKAEEKAAKAEAKAAKKADADQSNDTEDES